MRRTFALNTSPESVNIGASAPTVSVIIAYYKQEAFLMETVVSVKSQTYPNIEIIVVDDGSPVTAASILGSLDQVTIFRTENRGCPAARNFGFKRSSGEYLVFLDSDDRLSPGAIEAHLKMFARHADAALSFGSLRVIDENGREIRPPHICRPRSDYFLMLLEGNPIGCPGAAMIRRDTFVQVGLFDESFRIVEDYLLYLRIARKYRIVQHDTCVVDYRSHNAGLSKNRRAMLESTMAALDLIESENNLTKRERRIMRHGRARWAHGHRIGETFTSRCLNVYYRFRAALTVPWKAYFRKERSSF